MEALMESVRMALIVLGSINLTLVCIMFIKETKPYARPLVALTGGAISVLAFIYGNWVAGSLYLLQAVLSTIIVIDDLVLLGKLKEEWSSLKSNISEIH